MSDEKNKGELITAIANMLASGASFADLAGVPKENLEALYSLAYFHYNAKNYEDAKKIFNALCIYDGQEEKYFMGLASCEQGLGNYQRAADLYSLTCALSGLVDPKPMYFAALCLLKLDRKDDAIVALDSIDVMGRPDVAEDNVFKDKAVKLLKVLQNKD